MTNVLFGLEVMNLGMPGEGAPYRFTADVWDSDTDTIYRYQMTSTVYEKRERTLEEVARYQADRGRRDEIARELDRLDREAAQKIAPIMDKLQRDQLVVIHGPEILKLIDETDN